MSDTWITYVENAFTALVRTRGGDSGTNGGRELPYMNAVDVMALLTQISPAIVRQVQIVNDHGDRVFNTRYANAEGRDITGEVAADDFNAGLGALAGSATPPVDHSLDSITAAQYVAGAVDGSDPAWIRFNVSPGAKYTPVANATIEHDATVQLSALRNTMVDWQRAIDQATYMITFSFTGSTSIDDVKTLRSILQSLAAGLDALGEAPPPTQSEIIAGALASAASKSEDAVRAIAKGAGSVAAEVGDLAGSAAGAFAKGFFSQATLLTLAVAGVAVFLLVR